MADVTLLDAARRYFEVLSTDDRAASQAEVERFVRWCGADRGFDQVRGQEVANYAETLTGTVADANERAEAVRKFLAYAKKEGLSSTNLGTHLRVRKTSAGKGVRGRKLVEVHMTQAEKDALELELESLKAQRPRIIAEIQRAMADKDFRENAPLDAARDQQGHVEGRIREVEAKLNAAVIIEDSGPTTTHLIEVGSTVALHNLSTGKETTYSLVRPGDVNAAEGRISFESPVGRALLGHRVGDEVEVAVPSGTVRFRVERIEG